ncbi:MotA/TolQ/ExbB proton channel family protein [Trinickia diaoshuihuensis]|uniref:MotA/TolQ/ExbB proton channel family protein n=1 Tax=Trinickia diaoshuihuensis TaxID=2292265 RepID=UPI000E25AD1E|nr:MotA/TolQ/ExbB proton channel family protein [Trinickia diaoshuihuensis]
MNAWAGFIDAVRLGGWVVYPLSALAVAALAIAIDRTYVLWRFARLSAVAKAALKNGEAAPRDLIEALPAKHAYAHIARPLLASHAPLWHIEASIEAAASGTEREMNQGLWLLETIVTAAPLLGLLGTIVGMMRSFRLIGADGLVDPTGVSGGVAQALIATAIGLVIALAALFAFNYFSRRVDRLMDELEAFANAALAQLRLVREQRDAEVAA